MSTRILVAVIGLFLLGCVANTEESNMIGELPHPTNFQNDRAYFQYVDELNWHMIYLFAYTQSMNDYAKSKGWRPPLSPPLCKLVDWPQLEVLPKFVPTDRTDDSTEQFETELSLYVKYVRSRYENGVAAVETAQRLQLKQCIY